MQHLRTINVNDYYIIQYRILLYALIFFFFWQRVKYFSLFRCLEIIRTVLDKNKNENEKNTNKYLFFNSF